jgi:hypothetical protein
VARRKATKGGSADDEGPPYLAPGFTAFGVAAALDDREAKGRALLAQIDDNVYPLPGRADEVRASYRAWHNYNATYLDKAFTTRELRREYEGIGWVAFGGPESDLDRIRDTIRDLQRDINKLMDIKVRLPLYERPASHPGAVPPPQASSPLYPQSINVTIHHVGQLNLADVLQHAEARIKQVDRRGDVPLAEALQKLADAINTANEAAEDQREDALDAVAELAEVGAMPTDERGRMGRRVGRALKVIGELADTVPSVLRALEAVGPNIKDHLPHP